MRRYEPSTPRFVMGLAAAAITVIAMGVLVILPAQPDAYDDPLTAFSAFLSAATVAAGTSSRDEARADATTLRCTSAPSDAQRG